MQFKKMQMEKKKKAWAGQWVEDGSGGVMMWYGVR